MGIIYLFCHSRFPCGTCFPIGPRLAPRVYGTGRARAGKVGERMATGNPIASTQLCVPLFVKVEVKDKMKVIHPEAWLWKPNQSPCGTLVCVSLCCRV